MKKRTQYLIGVDEAGRGPLFGPVAVGVVAVSRHLDVQRPSAGGGRGWAAKLLSEARDSKVLSEKVREEIYERMVSARREGELHFAVGFVSARVIDREGIAPAIRTALTRALSRVVRDLGITPEECTIRLDGGLRAPAQYPYQETIIKGDATEPAISLASIVAKVSRDRRMHALDRRHPKYGFAHHKGYGTAAHYEAIRTHGLLPDHRRSFLRSMEIPKS